jgi:tetratricopeptide (TPR) repeat protein
MVSPLRAALLIAALLIAAFSAPSVAVAQPQADNAQVEQLAGEAHAAYQAGDFTAAVSSYLKAYRLSPAAAVLYNVAVIYDRKLTEPSLAMDFYRRYIGSPDADPGVVARATTRLQQLKAQKIARDTAVLDPQPRPEAPAVVAPAPAPASTWHRTVGWTALGLGVAAAGAGTWFGLQAQDSQDDFETLADRDLRERARDDGERQALTADVLLGLGAAAAVSGVVLLWVAPDAEPALGFRLTPLPGGGALGLGGSL